jgi:hypothetical protein
VPAYAKFLGDRLQGVADFDGVKAPDKCEYWRVTASDNADDAVIITILTCRASSEQQLAR